MGSVTFSRKRYISVCAGCDCLFETQRSDRITCSPACRVKAHRSGMGKIRQMADLFKVSPASLQHAAAVGRLRPDLAYQMIAGSLSMDDAMVEVVAAYNRLLMQQARNVR